MDVGSRRLGLENYVTSREGVHGQHSANTLKFETKTVYCCSGKIYRVRFGVVLSTLSSIKGLSDYQTYHSEINLISGYVITEVKDDKCFFVTKFENSFTKISY